MSNENTDAVQTYLAAMKKYLAAMEAVEARLEDLRKATRRRERMEERLKIAREEEAWTRGAWKVAAEEAKTATAAWATFSGHEVESKL